MIAELPGDERPIIAYRLVLTVAGAYYRDVVTIEAEDPLELEPTLEDRGEFSYERYSGDEPNTYVEVRLDHVVARRIEAIHEVPAPVRREMDDDIDLPAEERITRPEETR